MAKCIIGLVNRIGVLKSKGEIDTTTLSEAKKLIEILDPQIEFTDRIVISGFVQAPNANPDSTREDSKDIMQGFSMGAKRALRIWPYIITKVSQEKIDLLNLYYEDPGDTERLAVESRRIIHLLYTKSEKSLTGIVKSRPVVRTLPGVRVITYSQQRLWGKGKVDLAGLTIQWGLFR